MVNSTLKTQNLTNGVQSGSKLNKIKQYSWLKIMLEPAKENLSQAGFEKLEDLYFALERFIDFQIEDNIMKMNSLDFTQEDYTELKSFLSKIDINKLNEREQTIIRGFNDIIKSQNIANLTLNSASTSLNDFLFQEFLAQEIPRNNEQSLIQNKSFYNSFEDITEGEENFKESQKRPSPQNQSSFIFDSFQNISIEKYGVKSLDDSNISFVNISKLSPNSPNKSNNSDIKSNESNSVNDEINNNSKHSNQNKPLKPSQPPKVISNTLNSSDKWIEEYVDNLPSKIFQSLLSDKSDDSQIIPNTPQSKISNLDNRNLTPKPYSSNSKKIQNGSNSSIAIMRQKSIKDDVAKTHLQSINESDDSKIITDTINSSINQKSNFSNYTNFDLTTSTPKSNIPKIIPNKQNNRLCHSTLTPIKLSTTFRGNLESNLSFVKNQIEKLNFQSPNIKLYYQEFLINANKKHLDTRLKLRDKVDLNIERGQKKALTQDQIYELRELDVKTWIDGFENFYKNGGAGEGKRLSLFKKLLNPDTHLNDVFQSSRLQKLASYKFPKDEELFKSLKNYALHYLALNISNEIANQTDTLQNNFLGDTGHEANYLIMSCSIDSLQDAKKNVIQTLKVSQSNALDLETKPRRSILKSTNNIDDNTIPFIRSRNG